ncbi:MAG TPA: YraN family protein [Flavobacteriales bacterium]|nr:YraN family protein [Flavobacteriales bacterium]
MAKHNQLGKEGELIAFMFLQKEGFRILKTNWRYQKAEVDIIAQKDDFLVFIEVKTRGSKKFGKPEEAIDNKKIALYKDAVEGYLKQSPSQKEIRFDVISIVIAKDETQIEYFPDAF